MKPVTQEGQQKQNNSIYL